MLTGVSKPTIKKIINSSLKIIKKYIKNNPKILGGDDVIVEGIESLFGWRKYNRGRRRNQIWVVGFVEKTLEQKVDFCTNKKRNKKSLSNIISKK